MSILFFIRDTPPYSLKNSNASPKVKITKEGIGVHSLIHNTSRVEGRVEARVEASR